MNHIQVDIQKELEKEFVDMLTGDVLLAFCQKHKDLSRAFISKVAYKSAMTFASIIAVDAGWDDENIRSMAREALVFENLEYNN